MPRQEAPSWAPIVLAASVAALLLLLLVRAAAPGPATSLAVAVGLIAAAGIAWEMRSGRPFSLTNLVFLSCLLTFCARPLYLLAHEDRLGSYRAPRTPLDFLTDIRTQEIAEFVTRRYPGSVPDLITSAELIGAIFLVAFVGGRVLGGRLEGRRPGFRLTGRHPSPEALNATLAVLILVGLVGQALVIRGAGGVSAALSNLENQGTLQQPFVSYVLASFAVVAMLLWAAFGALRGASLAALSLLAAEVLLFGLLTGSRSIALTPLLAVAVVIHFSRRRFRARELATGALGLLLLASLLLGVRQVSAGRPLAESLREGVSNAGSFNLAANDLGQFDAVVMMAAMVPDRLEHQGGRRLVAGASAMLPRAAHPGKPQNGDVWFRQQVWGDGRPAGRPYTFPGELWLDFRWPGLIVGGVALGLLCGRFRGDGGSLMEPDRAVTAAALFVMVFALMDGVYATAATVALGLGFPLAAAALLLSVTRLGDRHG